MTNDHLIGFALSGCTLQELRSMAERRLGLDPEIVSKLGQADLVGRLSQASSHDSRIRRELKEKEISFKPSFYLLSISRSEKGTVSQQLALRSARSAARELNHEIISSEAAGATPESAHGYEIERVENNGTTIDGVITWQKPLRYWERGDAYEFRTVLTLELGFFVVDLAEKYGVIACHTLAERHDITRIIEKIINGSLTPIRFTKPLLAKIEEFREATRAGYTRSSGGKAKQSTPANIAFADERLAQFLDVQRHELSAEFYRSQTFYRTDFQGSRIGLGVTSDTGKIWLPRNETFTSVKLLASELLSRISSTLDELTRQGEYQTVLETMGFSDIEPLNHVNPGELRKDVCALGHILIEMLINRTREQPFVLPRSFVVDGVPNLFLPPDMRLVDANTGIVSNLAMDGLSTVRAEKKQDGEIEFYFWSSRKPVPNVLKHPLTHEDVEVGRGTELLHQLRLFPTKTFRGALLKLVEMAAARFEMLERVLQLPFFIERNTVYLDCDAAFGDARRELPARTDFASVKEFEFAASNTIPTNDADLRNTLFSLGEKCVEMSDQACETCTRRKQTVCLRSIVACAALHDHVLLAHKGIERSDLQINITVDGVRAKALGFAKLAQKRSGSASSLTLRNNNGAVLLSQVVSQVARSDFDIVAVLSPSPFSEDLIEALETVCGPYKKSLLHLRFDELAKLFIEWKQGLEVENILVEEVLRASSRKASLSKARRVGHS
jgi:hypothetical protein